MSVRIYVSQYKNQRAITIESERIAAQFLPGIGAKLASLIYKPLGFEVLVQKPWKEYRVQPYDGNYVAGECSGLDDMFPTIDECYYESYPWKGTRLPDHGEVWSLPWDLTVERERLCFVTHGVRFPYRLEKRVSLVGEGTLHFAYQLTNLSPFEFAFMWAAHPMINLEEGAELVLPSGVKEIVTVLSQDDALGTYGDHFTWPVAKLPDGQEWDLRWMKPKSARRFAKYFVRGRMPEGWCALKYHRSNLTLVLSFPVDRVPYLGILPNEGGWDDLYNIFLEPGTAPLDRIDVARLHHQLSTVPGKGTYEWYLDITLLNGTGFTGLNK